MSCRSVVGFVRRISSAKNVLFHKSAVSHSQTINLNQERGFRRSYPAILKVMKLRRTLAGSEKNRKRSEWLDWNYNSELYAFNKRLHENITYDTLSSIFIDDSYVRMEEQKRKDMDLQDVQFDLKSNSSLAKLGGDIMSKFIKCYLRHAFKFMPEEGICAVHDYLVSDDVLSHVSFNIGTSDLIFCAEHLPEKNTLASTLKAVVGGIASDDSVARAENFVLDFVCPQLIGKDIFEIWEFDKPFQILNGILQKQGHETTESRLIFESGRNTIEAIYHIGLYSNRVFLGRGAGETLNFAEEMAAYDALRRMFHLTESKMPLAFGEEARKIELKSKEENSTINELCGSLLKSIKLS